MVDGHSPESFTRGVGTLRRHLETKVTVRLRLLRFYYGCDPSIHQDRPHVTTNTDAPGTLSVRLFRRW